MKHNISSKRQWMMALSVVTLLSGCATNQPQSIDRQKLMESVDPSLRASAKNAVAKEDYKAAAGYYRSLLVMHPNDPELAIELSKTLRYDQKAEEALPLISGTLEADPQNPALMMELGKVLIDLSRPEDAVETLEEAKSLIPSDWEVYSALGVAYDYMGDWEKAQEIYQIGLGFSSKSPALLNNMALSLAQSGNLGAAVVILEGAIQRVDATPRMRQNLALFKALQGDADGAARLARRDLPKGTGDQNVEFLKILAEQRRSLP